MSEQPRKTIRVVTALVEREGRYLITQRRPGAVLPLLWEFPGGRVEPGETDRQALRREMQERLGVDVRVGDWVLAKPHAYEQYTVDMWLYECTLLSDELRNVGVHGYRWVTSDEFKDYEFTPVDEASMNKLLGEE